MQSTLIISPNKSERENFAVKLCDSYHIHPLDRIFLQVEGTIGIEDIRKLQQSLQLKPLRGSDKAVMIYNAQTMTPEAQNAFLKTLEEPPDNTYIILTAETETAFLPTILSRCKIITLTQEEKKLRDEEIKKLIEQFQIVMKGSIGDKLYLAQLLGEKKETALEWLTSAIFYLHNALLKDAANPAVSGHNILLLEQFQGTYKIIKTTNVNPRFALEKLFLNITN